MHVSLSELEATLMKAASGVGLPLGLGQDWGRAARWMAGNGYDPLAVLVDALDAVDRGRSGGFDAGQAIHGSFVPDPPADCLSSLRAGPSACDLLVSAALGDRQPRAIALAAVDFPAVILMAARAASRAMTGALVLAWRSAEGATIEATCQAGRLSVKPGAGDPLSLPGPAAMTLSLIDPRPLDGATTGGDDRKEGASVDEASWRRLAAFADRYLVEATETSRLKGAGAGLVDTD